VGSAQFQRGSRFGPYVVLEVLAQGGQGIVFKARHSEVAKVVALKVLLEPDPPGRARFRQEAQVLANLRHPNLPVVSSLGEERGRPYVALEYVEGQDLKSVIRSRGVPDFAWTVSALAAVARTVHYCHEQGVVHRDLKPANILVEAGTERPVLVDFGLLKRDPAHFGQHLSVDALSRLSATGEFKGTPGFMAPEQADPSLFGGRLRARRDALLLGHRNCPL
jgi:serine/threonine protein kinase